MSAVEWTPRAEIELEEIALHIWLRGNGPKVAREIVTAIRDKAEQYGRQPELGTRHEAVPDDVRLFRHIRFVVAYQIRDGGITVLRVVDGVRDFGLLFRDL